MAEKFEIEISTKELFDRFFSPSTSSELCAKCPCFGVRWSCPPFEKKFEPLAYSRVKIFARKVKADGEIRAANAAARADFDNFMLAAEKGKPSSLAMFAGGCANCELDECPRVKNLPCPMPEKMRISPEAAGYDVSKIAKELFGLDMDWGAAGAPQTLTLTAALFFD